MTDQTFDTNLFDFTTNFFRAYDVPLATNGNWITLHVTDRAGNTTTTNFYVALDYSAATNPPTVNLIWPQDGMAVSGSNCTIRGTMSDETGTIQAQIVDEDGNTNTVQGIVERNGMFWIENVPLNGETGIILQATDAAGNVTTTDFTVEPSDLILTITGTPSGDDLWHGAGMIYGTVSDPNATVTVNGTNAVVDNSYANGDGTYNWTATSVPISGQGTATFDAVAYSEQSSLSSHLRSMTMNAATPSTPPANTSLPVEMQSYVAMISYNCTEVQKYSALDYGNAWYQQTVKSQSAQPTTGTNGQWVLNDRRVNSMYWYDQEGSYSDSGHEKFTWGISPPDDGQEHTDDSWGDSYDGPAQWPYWDGLSLHLLQAMPHEDQSWGCASCGPGYEWATVRHYFADGVQYHWDLGANTTFDLNVSAKTQMELFTGGKAQVSRKNVFEVDAGATEILQPPLDYGTGYPWWDVPGKAVDNSTLTVAGKSVGADGKLWLVLPDNSDMDLTVIARGKKHYDANSSAQKYKPYITANDVRLDPSAINVTNCVGQKIVFKLQFDPAVDYVTNQNNWVLPGKYVNAQEWFQPDMGSVVSNTADGTYYLTMCHPEQTFYSRSAYSIDSPYCTFYKQSAWPLSQPETGAWWIDGGPKAVTRFPKLTFSNGQTVSLGDVYGNLYVDKPQASFDNANASIGPVSIERSGQTFPGAKMTSGDVIFSATITSAFSSGKANWTQLIKRHTSGDGLQFLNNLFFYDTYGNTELDNIQFYNTQTDLPDTTDGNMTIQAGTNTNVPFSDRPSIGIASTSYLTLTDTFNTYLVFNPDPNNSDNIWVTLGRVNWGWSGYAGFDISNNKWVLISGSTNAPTFTATDDFPNWTNVYHNSK